MTGPALCREASLSPAAIAYLERQVAERGAELRGVRLSCRAADRFERIADGSLDGVILTDRELAG